MRVDAGRKCFVYLSILAVALGLVLPAFFAPERARADSWVQEADAGFTGGFNRMQLDASATATFDDGSGSGPRLFMGTFNLQGTGCQVWRQDGPLPGNWTQVNLDGFGDPNNIEVSGMSVYAHGGTSYLYVATQNGATGGEIWRTAGAGGAGGGPYTDWTPIAPAGSGTNANGSAVLATDGNFLYAGTFNSISGCEIWSSKGTPVTPYTDWAPMTPGGFGNPANWAVSCFHVFASGNGFLHAGTINGGGCEVWSLTPTGWTRVDTAGGAGGFGNPNNVEASSMSDLNGVLYVGTRNGNGCELWGSAGLTAGPPPPSSLISTGPP